MEVRRDVIAVLVCTLLTLSSFASADICGQSYVFLNAGENETIGEGCTVYGQTLVANATLTLNGGVITEYNNNNDGVLLALDGSTVDIYAGTITESSSVPASLIVGDTAVVTIYGSDFVLDGVALDPSQTTIHSRDPYEVRTLSGVYENGDSFTFTINLNTNASISLGWPQTAPEIEVYPLVLAYDFGEVEVGESTTVLVQIFNFGTADLNVSSVSLIGDPALTLTSGPATPLVIAPNTSVGVDFEVTFSPAAEGIATATVEILSDDADESVVEVLLVGTGIITEVPPSQQIQDILDYFDTSVSLGTMQGYGPGNSAEKRLNALHNMVESVSDLINAGAYAEAIDQLDAISKKTDGVAKPQDFVVGEAVAELNAMIQDLIAELLL